MPLNKSFLRRMEVLDACFSRKYKRWTIALLLNSINERLYMLDIPRISKRTLYADIHSMQHEFNAPIERYKYGNKICYRYSQANYSILKAGLLEEDVQCLQTVTNLLRKTNEKELVQQLEEILERFGPPSMVFFCK
ncbi:MAG: hypothetical protein JNK20_02550 [Flavipsychrobacter sp.]|nr:hypothetical protein [Flavipsychrobacter sp.]